MTAVPFKIANSSYLIDGLATTDVASGLTNEETTFVPGQVKDTGNTTSGVTLEMNQFTELEFAIQPTDNVDLDSNYCFRLTSASGTNIAARPVYGQMSFPAATWTSRITQQARRRTSFRDKLSSDRGRALCLPAH